MAPPYFLTPFITTLFFLSIPPSHQKLLETPTISAAPAVLPDPPLPPYAEVPPDVAPLLPSPGRAARSPAGLSMPTIPSTRSPNPDMVDSVGPDTALAPTAMPMDSSAFCDQVLVKGVFGGGLVFWLVVIFMM